MLVMSSPVFFENNEMPWNRQEILKVTCFLPIQTHIMLSFARIPTKKLGIATSSDLTV